MGILLGQLPPAELARLKAELAETLIANFCYPRFFDYRTGSLRMRPIDRTKRQEVWLFLSSIDFTAWNRLDIMSSDFPRYIERLFIQFVKHNRNFFGQQGRKRMPDVRMLINSSAITVTEGLRGHLTGQRLTSPPFGSPHPVSSWATTNITGHPEPNWEQIVSATMLLQQQLQEMRGETKAPTTSEARPASPASLRRTTYTKPSSNGTDGVQHQPIHRPELPPAQPVALNLGIPKEKENARVTPPEPKSTKPLAPPMAPASPAAPTPSMQKEEKPVASHIDMSTQETVAPAKLGTTAVSESDTSDQNQVSLPPAKRHIREVPPQSQPQSHTQPPGTPPISLTHVQEVSRTGQPAGTPSPAQAREPQAQAQAPLSPPSPIEPSRQVPTQRQIPVQPPAESSREVAQVQAPQAPLPSPVPRPHEVPQIQQAPATGLPARKTESAAPFIGNEDIAIFEQLRHQILIWLKVEAVRSGVDISGQSPTQLLELLRQQDGLDETRLQIISTLLNLSNQVIKNGHASLFDYKQGMMFYLMHTRR